MPASPFREFDPDAPAEKPAAQTARERAVAMVLTALLFSACLLLALALPFMVEFPID